jgi:dipeptidyl-peptidase 9
MFVAVYSNIQKLPTCQVFRISHTDWTVEGVILTPVGYLLEPCGKRMVLLAFLTCKPCL